MRKKKNPQAFDEALPLIVKHGGAILLGPGGMWPVITQDVRAYVKATRKKLRAPHYTVSPAALRRELVKASDGVLLLDEMEKFSDAALLELETDLSQRAAAKQPTATLMGIVLTEPGDTDQEARAARLASIYKVPLLRSDSDGEIEQVGGLAVPPPPPAAPPPSPAEQDLDRINRHRAQIGMRPLDPVGAGWSEKDLQIEAQQIRQRFGNPELEAGRLVRLRPDEVFAKVTSHSGFASVVQLLGYAPQTYYSFDRRGSASTSYFVVTNTELELLRGVASRARFGRKEKWRKTRKMRRDANPELDMGKVVRLLPGEIPVKAGSHRAYEKVKRTLDYKPQTYYSFQRSSSAGTYHFFLSQEDYEKVKKIRGVGKWRMKAGERWLRTIRFGRENPEWEDRLPGGLADRYTPDDFDQSALAEGTRVEMEHTSDSRIATEIAMDHLVEDPRYYEKLRTIHHNPDDIAATKARMLAY